MAAGGDGRYRVTVPTCFVWCSVTLNLLPREVTDFLCSVGTYFTGKVICAGKTGSKEKMIAD